MVWGVQRSHDKQMDKKKVRRKKKKGDVDASDPQILLRKNLPKLRENCGRVFENLPTRKKN